MLSVHSILHGIKRICSRLLVNAISLLVPVDTKKVYFISFLGKSYSDNPRSISEQLHLQNPEYKIVWAFVSPHKEKQEVPAYVKKVKIRSLKHLYELTTAGFWVDNYCKNLDTKKRKGQYYIQTWHGDRGPKRILADSVKDKNNYQLFESLNCDLCVSGSEFGDALYRSSFKYNGDILSVGCPRNDALIGPNSSKDQQFIRNRIGIPVDYRVLLYAPTFRDCIPSKTQIVNLNIADVVQSLEKTTNEKWLVLLRGHTGRKLILEGMDHCRTIDTSDYEDAKDLLFISDALISDYSSIAPDFALRKKPIFLYVSDINLYQQNDRKLWYRIEDTPFWFAKTAEELNTLISNFTWDKAVDNCEQILKFYGTHETGSSSEAVCNWIVNHTK